MFGKLKEKLMGGSAAIELGAPVNGKVIPLNEVADPTFAEGILGQGSAVIPADGRIFAPADGTIDVMFDTAHAVSMTTADGVELLIHVGLDTVQLKGTHYAAHCKAGDRVHKGDLLIEFEPEAVQAEGYDIVTPVIVCNSDDFKSIKPAQPGLIDAGETLLTLQKK